MKQQELKNIESELEKRGYRKYTRCLTSNETYAWFKTHGEKRDEEGEAIGGYQVAFRVWDFTTYRPDDENAYGLDFWTSPNTPDGRFDFTANCDPMCNIDTFEKVAMDFYEMIKKYVNEVE